VVVAIAGGHGKIGLRTAQLLAEHGDQPVALIRNPQHEADVAAAGARAVVCDLESASAGEVAEAIAGVDAVVFAAGAGPGSGAERKETMDYGGAVLLIEGARRAGVRRYLMVSAMAADAEHEGEEVFDVYLRAKGRADAELAASGLDFTIVRPGMLTDDPGTGRVRAGESVPRGAIPRQDVAAVLVATLAEPATVGMTFELVSGDDPIELALRSLAG
jgi:uncharacterized protein YbjT (DUF2867 family)